MERLAVRVWPGITGLPAERRVIAALDVLGAGYYAILSLLGLAWLLAVSDWGVFRSYSLLFLVLLLLAMLFNRFRYFAFTELSYGRTSSVLSSMDGVAGWTAALLLGPVGLWVGVINVVVRFIMDLPGNLQASSRWELLRVELSNLAENTLARLGALAFYRALGGAIPFPSIEVHTVVVALLATAGMILLQQVIAVPFYVLLAAVVEVIDREVTTFRFLRFVVGKGIMLAVAAPFAVLAAGLYRDYGLWMMLFFFGGLVMVSYLANRSSRSALHIQLQSRMMEGLESLSRALLLAPPDRDRILHAIREHITQGRLHLPGRLEICLFPGEIILHEPVMWPALPEDAWNWLRDHPGAHHFGPAMPLPWNEVETDRSTALVSINDYDSGEMVGGIYHSVSARGLIDRQLYLIYLPVLNTLADQISLALRRVKGYQQLLQHRRVEEELRLAGDIQGSFLPDHFPELPGWTLSAMLVSARDTSGDFFDFFTLPDGRVGIVLADVADKGIGAALYMALSRAYLRSLALEKDPYPPATLAALNRRILQDTSSDLFVTLVYGMISPGNGRFIYCNGGHPPPLVVRSNPSQPIELLARTGMAVGVTENTEWEEGSIELSPGDYILMYSDGITEAQSDAGEFFGLERLISGVEAMRGRPPAEVREYLIQRVQDFSGDVQEDDIALLVLCKTG